MQVPFIFMFSLLGTYFCSVKLMLCLTQRTCSSFYDVPCSCSLASYFNSISTISCLESVSREPHHCSIRTPTISVSPPIIAILMNVTEASSYISNDSSQLRVRGRPIVRVLLQASSFKLQVTYIRICRI